MCSHNLWHWKLFNVSVSISIVPTFMQESFWERSVSSNPRSNSSFSSYSSDVAAVTSAVSSICFRTMLMLVLRMSLTGENEWSLTAPERERRTTVISTIQAEYPVDRLAAWRSDSRRVQDCNKTFLFRHDYWLTLCRHALEIVLLLLLLLYYYSSVPVGGQSMVTAGVPSDRL